MNTDKISLGGGLHATLNERGALILLDPDCENIIILDPPELEKLLDHVETELMNRVKEQLSALSEKIKVTQRQLGENV